MQDAATPPTPTTPLKLSQAVKHVPQIHGRPLHVSTFWRWARRGVKARNGATVRLAHRRVGGTLTTTLKDLDRFFEEIAENDLQSFRKQDTAAPLPGGAPSPDTAAPRRGRKPGTRNVALEQARDYLAAEGI